MTNHCDHVAAYYLERFLGCRTTFFKNMSNYYTRMAWGYSK